MENNTQLRKVAFDAAISAHLWVRLFEWRSPDSWIEYRLREADQLIENLLENNEYEKLFRSNKSKP